MNLSNRVTVCSFLERKYVAKETVRVAPLSAYPLLTFCLMASSSLSNLALNYINFPTKVVFRSCKLIPTMVVATIVHRKVFSSVEYFLAICISMGLVLFAAADWELTPTFHPIGLAFVTLSVCADAVLPNAQERLFRLGSSRLEVVFFTNIFTLIAMTVTTLLSGDLIGLIHFAQRSRITCIYIGVYTFVAYIAISVHMTVVKKFGGVAAVLLATARKGMTLVLSFILFPKAFSWLYVTGAVLVLGGLLASSLFKIYNKGASPPLAVKRKLSESDMSNKLNGNHNESNSDDDVELQTNGSMVSSMDMNERNESQNEASSDTHKFH